MTRGIKGIRPLMSYQYFYLALDLEAPFFVFSCTKAMHTEPLLATAHCLGIWTEDPHEDVHVCWFSFKAAPLDDAVVPESQCPLATHSQALSNVKGWALCVLNDNDPLCHQALA